MRLAILFGLVATAPLAFGQSPFTPEAPGSAITNPPAFTPPNLTANQPRFQWNPNLRLPQTIVQLPPPTRSRSNGARIDPQFARHPQPARLGDQPPGTLVAQNQFPGLRYMPIAQPKPRLEPIPILWPNLKLEQIPTQCLACRNLPIQDIPQFHAEQK